MPSNQSSPWDGGKLRSSNANGPNTAAPVRTHTKTVPVTKVPFTQTSLEIFKQKDLAKPHLNVWENGDRNKTNNQSQFTALPEGYSTLPQIINGIQIPNQILTNGLKPAESSLTETDVSSSFAKKECHDGHNGLSTDAIQVFTSLQTSQPEKGSIVRRFPDALCDAKVGSEPLLLSGCHQDLFIQGQSSLQQTDKSMAADCSSSPPVPAPCLNPSEPRGPTMGQNASSHGNKKTEKRSTIRETFSTKRCHSARLARKYNQKKNSCTMRHSHNQLQVKGCSPAVLASAKRSQTQTFATLNMRERLPETTVSSGKRIGPLLNVQVGAAEEQESKPPVELTDVARGPAGTSVGSVTTQISAIQLTKPRQPGSMLSSSPYPSYYSPSPTEECQDGEAQLLGEECFMQVDGVEEELPDELENACSDDDNSDCSSINGALSSASTDLLSGVEEPMSVGQEDDREEKPALVPSLFAFMSPTLYFSSTNEKVELLPVEQRRLLKWKMSNVTPNVVKHTIARSHFRSTRKSSDWLGCWGHHMKSVGFKALGENQKLNHFPGTFQIGRKDRLWRNLSRMQVRFGKQEFSFFPRTFILPQDIKLLRKAWEDGGSRQKWIVKPPASARGIGIQVIHKWSQMPRKRPLLVQKYLHKPYLISGNKFDLRIYVYVTSYDPLRIYIFTDGLVRFASCKYSSSMKTLGNKFMHLTNYSINKNNAEYQANSDDKACQGHKWAIKALWQYLGSKGVNTGLIWEKIKDIVIKTIIASEPYVNNLMKQHVHSVYSCHELFGFDIMLDENLKPWILEVNISPSLHSNSALDASIKGQMIRDLLNLAGYRIPQKEDGVASGSNASRPSSSLSKGNKERTKSEVIADEKVKRAFYLTQRFADQDFLSTVLHVLTPEDVRVLAESENEMSRRGEFERVFPSAASSRYLRFFECPRYLNILLDQWEQKHWRDRTVGVALLQNLCLKGVHLGTNDPAHIWSKSSYISKYEPCRKDINQSRVVVSHHRRSHHDVNDNRSDRGVTPISTPISTPVSPSPGPSVSGSTCTSPQPDLTHSLLPHHFASL